MSSFSVCWNRVRLEWRKHTETAILQRLGAQRTTENFLQPAAAKIGAPPRSEMLGPPFSLPPPLWCHEKVTKLRL